MAEQISEEAGAKTIPLLDTAQGVLRFGGIERIYQKTMSSFVEDFQSTVHKITSVVDADEELIARAVHGLKGVAGTLAATRLHELCIETEGFCNCNRSEELQQHLKDIISLLHLSKETMEEYLNSNQQEEPPQVVTPLSSAKFKTLLDALNRNDAAALTLFEQFKPALLNELEPAQFGRLTLLMGQLNFADALDIIRSIES